MYELGLCDSKADHSTDDLDICEISILRWIVGDRCPEHRDYCALDTDRQVVHNAPRHVLCDDSCENAGHENAKQQAGEDDRYGRCTLGWQREVSCKGDKDLRGYARRTGEETKYPEDYQRACNGKTNGQASAD